MLRHDTCDLRFLHAAQILAMQRLPVATLDQRCGHVLLPDVLQLARVLRKQRLVSQDTACRLKCVGQDSVCNISFWRRLCEM